MKTVLSIAGSDSSGGAGIQADLKTMVMHGVYGMSAVTALTAQNTTGVKGIQEVSPEFLRAQIDQVFEDIFPDAVKIGMVPDGEQVRVIGERLHHYGAGNLVVDPVMVATSGSRLVKNQAAEVLVRQLFPMARLVTPNLPEAEALWGRAIEDEAGMEQCAEAISRRYGCGVLLKGGHLQGGADDFLYENGKGLWFRGSRIPNPNTHGTGCTLSSAIAANLAKGENLEEAVRCARMYLRGALEAGLNLGAGSGPLDHGFLLRAEKEAVCNQSETAGGKK